MHLICGEALFDLFVEGRDGGDDGEILLRAVAGGSPFNVAVGMARLGVRVAFASDLARDVLGERIVAQLAREGVDDTFLRRAAPATALAIVSTDEAGKPSYGFYGLDQALNCPDVAAIEQAAATLGGIHIGSIALVLPNTAGPLLELARRFADRALVSLDPNVRLSIAPDAADWRRAIDAVRPFCHLIKVSEEDIAALYGDADPDTVCRDWLGDRTALVVLTKGAAGAAMHTRKAGRIEISPADTTVVDTVGAGDSFMAALLSALIRRGWASPEAIASLDGDQFGEIGRFSALAAGVTCSRRGPISPTSFELDALCNRPPDAAT